MRTWAAVRQIIEDRNMTMAQVSRRLGKSEKYLSVVTGSTRRRSPSVKTVSEILRSVGGWHVEIVADDGSQSFRVEE